MSYFVVDIESDGPSPAKHSMVCFGAVKVTDMDTTFYGETEPINDKFIPEALAISGFSREQHEGFRNPKLVMQEFYDWVMANNELGTRPIFISDNPAFDWQWINYYFDLYDIRNPFGWSARRIGDMYCGIKGDVRARWKHLRKTNHDHHPVNDAKGNAEVLIHMRDKMGLKVRL